MSELEADAGNKAKTIELAMKIFTMLANDTSANSVRLKQREQQRIAELRR